MIVKGHVAGAWWTDVTDLLTRTIFCVLDFRTTIDQGLLEYFGLI